MSERLSGGAFLALLLAAFIVSLAYGVGLPILPFLLERRLGPGADIGWHAGLLTGIYTFALFLFAPLWGKVSDGWQRRGVILVGLAGFAAALVVLAFINSLPALYLGRFLSGAFAAAILPVGLALAADWSTDEQARARLFGRINIAVLVGALAGPAAGGLLGGMWRKGLAPSGAPFLVVALTAVLVAILAFRSLPHDPGSRKRGPQAASSLVRGMLYQLLFLSALVAAALGTLEVGVALRAESTLKLSPEQTGWMFVECMLAMVLAQALVFNPWFPARHTHWLLMPAFVLLAVALVLLASVGTPGLLFVAVGGVAAMAGIVSPILAFWMSLAAGGLQGSQLGRQAAAASLGQAGGSAAAGLLFSSAFGEGSAFYLAAAGAVVGGLMSLPLSRSLTRLAQAPAGSSGRTSVAPSIRAGPG